MPGQDPAAPPQSSLFLGITQSCEGKTQACAGNAANGQEVSGLFWFVLLGFVDYLGGEEGKRLCTRERPAPERAVGQRALSLAPPVTPSHRA